MGRIVVTEFMSLDGVMEGPGGDNDFVRGAWSFEFERGEEGDKFKVDELEDAEGLLLGRRTYEGFAAAWPSRSGDPFSDKFNAMPKYVVSSTLENPEWNNSTVLKGDVVEALTKLREEREGNLLLSGSAQLAKTVIEHDLFDELRLMVFPVVLGTGIRLFGETTDMKKLQLKESKTVGDGIVTMVYEPA
jgi:dihydrofolate reductase